MFTRPTLVNISIFMRMAAEGGKLQSVQDVMAFAETVQFIDAAINEMDKKNPPKKAPAAPVAPPAKKAGK